MQNKAQKLFIVLWLLFAVYALLDSLYHIFVLDQLNNGLMYLGASAMAYFMHRVRKKQYSQED
ncbi:MAG: hypothetical protein QMC03_01950 [Flavobacteriales bacterium]|jgi:hypothetical protein